MRFSSFAAAAATLGMASASPLDVEVSDLEAHKFMARQSRGLAAAMKAAGRQYIGTSLTIRNDNAETNIIKSEFNSITPENAMKWDATEPNRGSFSFSGGDAVANFATQNGMELRCHTLVWHSQLPSWVSSGSWSNSSLQAVMQSHINNVAGRWKGKCTHWDVVNEALNEDGSYRDSVFYRVIGESFIPIAFRMAAAADPNTKLYYNDYNLAYGGAKARGAVRIVKNIQAHGLRIDGVGLQGHMTSESTPTNSQPTPSREVLANALRMFTDLGVDVAYTEIDVRMNMPATQSKLQAAAAAWGRMAGACMDVSRCIGMTVWGIADKYSWVPGTFNGEGSALLWDDNYNKKLAYQGFYDAIVAGGQNPPTTTTSPPTSTTSTVSTSTSTTSSAPATTTTASTNCSAKWGQCGGIGWSGPTCCQSGSQCKYSNDWYSQCI